MAESSPQQFPDPELMSIKELKAELINLKVDFSDCYDKMELIARLKFVQEKLRNMLTIDARTTSPASAVVIFLHGLGDSARGWLGPMHAVATRLPHVRFVLPNAPILPVTLSGGQPMPAWYDVAALDPAAEEDEHGITISERFVHDIIADEVTRVPPSRIVVGGFAQGGAVAVNAAIRHHESLGGAFCLSGWLPRRAHVGAATHEANKGLPVFMAHGTADAVVSPEWGEMSHAALSESLDKERLVWKVYTDMNHQSTSAEMNDLAAWLLNIIP